MGKFMAVLAALLLAGLGMAGTAAAQDAVIGTVTADPATVEAPGEHTFTATGADFIPDTAILLVACTSPAETLVPGTSDEEAVRAAALAIDPLADCDIANAQNVDVDSSGAWTAQLTTEVGDNFFLSAGALDGSQAGATWIPIVPAGAAADDDAAEEEDLAETGVETGLLGVIGVAVLGAGVLVVREGRRIKN